MAIGSYKTTTPMIISGVFSWADYDDASTITLSGWMALAIAIGGLNGTSLSLVGCIGVAI